MTDYQFTVYGGMTESQIIAFLEKQLPLILVTRYKMEPLYAESYAKKIAPFIVEHAKSKGELHLLSCQPEQLLSVPDNASESLDQELAGLIRFRQTEQELERHSNLIKLFVGKLWSHIARESKEDQEANAVVGVRG